VLGAVLFLVIFVGVCLVGAGAYLWLREALEPPGNDGKILFVCGVAIAGVGGLVALILKVFT